MGIPAAIRYLRECYREDNVRAGYWDLFGKGVSHRLVVEGEEQLADGLLDHIPFPRGYDFGETVRDVALRSGEFELLYGILFVGGRASLPGTDRERRICAPLFLFPARLDESRGFPAVEVDVTERRINTALLDLLAGEPGDLIAALAAELPPHRLGEREVSQAGAILREHCPGLDCGEMLTYPRLLDKGRLRNLAAECAKDGAGRRLIPAAALALWPKSEAARGIVTELASLADSPEVSAPLLELLGGAPPSPPLVIGDAPPLVPAVLSESQETIVRSALRYPLTFVNGPPGTGKSFTVAAVALDHMARGKSVLIASQTDNAVDVVGDKIASTHGVEGCVVRAGKKQYLRALKKEIEMILGGARTFAQTPVSRDAGGGRHSTVLPRDLARMGERFDARCRQEERLGEALLSTGGGVIGWLRRWFATRRAKRSRPLTESIATYEELLEAAVENSKRALAARRDTDLRHCLRHHRAELQRFLDALRARKGARKESIFEEIDFSAVLAAFPVWLVKLSDVSRVLPLGAELFDIAIIDEATQVDMASALPVLQRAKRAVVAGDPQQLRHLSFLSRGRQAQLAERFGVDDEHECFDYRSTSLLDLVASRIGDQEQVGFLNEHFRSTPEIIAFSNERFYSRRLNIMTEIPSLEPRESGLILIAAGGERSPAGVNQDEIEVVLEQLKEIVAGEEPLSVGVLSPFRAQVDALRDAIAHRFSGAEFSALTHRHRLRVGTAHAFQGDERDVMLLSLAIDKGQLGMGLRFLERADVFNVTVTRARERQVVVASPDPSELPHDSLLRDYLLHARHSGDAANKPWRLASRGTLSGELSEALAGAGCEVIADCEVAGVTFDLVALRGARCVAVDLVGFPGRAGKALPLARYKMFRRAGTPVFPLAFSSWTFDREATMRAFARELGAR